MIYLLKVSAVISIFYLCYTLFLQRNTFFELNRWFLITGLITAFIIPLIVIPIYTTNVPLQISNFNINEITEVTQTPEALTVIDYLVALYAIGASFFFIRFISQLISLFSILKRNKSFKKGHHIYIETTNRVAPFSFFNHIVYNPKDYSSTELKQIIAHEQVHANQKHSLDILITQLACITLWFNPFIWLYNKNIKQNLEFIADHKAQNQFNSKSYQTTLLKTSLPYHQMVLSNNFYNSLIKKRIVMLHKSKSKKINVLKYALVVPLLAIFLFSCNSEKVIKNTSVEKQDNPWSTSLSINVVGEEKNGEVPLILLDGKEISNNELGELNADSITSMDVLKDEKAIEKYGDKGKNGVVIVSTKGKTKWSEKKTIKEQPLFLLDGKEITQEEMDKVNPDDIKEVNVLKDQKSTEKYGDKGKNGVVEITTKQ